MGGVKESEALTVADAFDESVGRATLADVDGDALELLAAESVGKRPVPELFALGEPRGELETETEPVTVKERDGDPDPLGDPLVVRERQPDAVTLPDAFALRETDGEPLDDGDKDAVALTETVVEDERDAVPESVPRATVREAEPETDADPLSVDVVESVMDPVVESVADGEMLHVGVCVAFADAIWPDAVAQPDALRDGEPDADALPLVVTVRHMVKVAEGEVVCDAQLEALGVSVPDELKVADAE